MACVQYLKQLELFIASLIAKLFIAFSVLTREVVAIALVEFNFLEFLILSLPTPISTFTSFSNSQSTCGQGLKRL